MSRSVTRRDLLIAGGLAASGVGGGCLIDNPETTGGHLYVENTSTGERQVAVSVVAGSDGTPEYAVHDWYSVPDGVALQLEGVIESGQTYTIRAALEGAAPADAQSAVIEPCNEGATGERFVSVRTRPDGLGVIPWGCEEAYRRRELEYVDATQHRVGTVTGTVGGGS